MDEGWVGREDRKGKGSMAFGGSSQGWAAHGRADPFRQEHIKIRVVRYNSPSCHPIIYIYIYLATLLSITSAIS
jgi:hypothetical protein